MREHKKLPHWCNMFSPPLITGPIPPFSNPVIEPQFYSPSRLTITAIALGINTTVTTITNHEYVIGQEIRLIIPYGSGCRQLNEQTGDVISIPNPNQVVVNINSTKSDPFVTTPYRNLPQIIPIGDVNSGQINANGPKNVGTFIPGSFINISPE